MINLQTGEQTYVSRLRVRCSGLDPLAAQLRLATLFRAAEVQPAGLPPSAIVCIRRLDDPRPRTVSLSGANSFLPPEWQQSVRASIEQLARRAPRPARDAVAADAPCVVFEDRAELLAALACDWCEQRAAARWWWRSLFKETIDAPAVVKLWRETPEYVPGALEHLARRQRAVAFARALAPGGARAILDSLVRRFALGELQAVVFAAPEHAGRSGAAGMRPKASQPETFPGDTAGGEFQPPPAETGAGGGASPWREFAPEASSHELELSQQCLLGVGLALHRAPVVVRGSGFALRIQAWMNAASPGRETNAVAAPPSSNAKKPRDARVLPTLSASKPGAASPRGAVHTPEGVRAASPVHVVSDKLQQPASEIRGARRGTPGFQDANAFAPTSKLSPQDGEPPRQSETSQFEARDTVALAVTSDVVESVAPRGEAAERGASAPLFELPDSRVEEQATGAPLPFIPEAEATHTTVSPLLEARIETRFGGLFHLVNLALFLELYGDFTAPAAQCIALPVWDFVALLGRRMAGACVEEDPVWPLLAQLSGRAPGEPPGDNFSPPGAWRMDAGWLRNIPAKGNWRWAVARDARGQGRLQVIHPEKFLLIDVPLDGEEELEAQLESESEVYAHAFAGKPTRAPRPLKIRGRTPLALWVERVHLYARARLRLALGTGDVRRAARLLCERNARVFVTATHVDILMRLAELPFEVRVAGLDRDPGWIPAAGRIVAFHFE